jgi:hypothetical protein
MPITQILLTANSGGGGGGGGPIAYAGYTTTPVEGGNTTVTLTVENWDGSQVYWTVVGKGEPAADPNTDMTGQLTGVWNPGVTSFTQTDATIISFVANDGTEGTEYWGVLLGSSPGANDYYDSNAWPINEPRTSWTIEWWQKSNSTQPAQFPRLFALGSFPHEIGFSMEGVFYAWLNGSAIDTGLGRSPGVWQHWAIVSDGINVRIYKDGVGVVLSNRINFGPIGNITDNLFIGSESGGANGFKGLITNFRVVKGQAMYNPTQNTITVPTVPLWSNSNTELLLKAVDSGNLVKDSSSRNRIPVGTGSNAFSSDTPFATPTPASPVIITQGQSWNPEVNTLYISRTTFPDVDSVQTGWSFESANYTATVISAVTEFDLRIIALSINSGVMDGSVGTFTQYQVGGSIEMYTSTAGYVAFDNGREWAFDLASSTYTLTPAANNVNEGSSLEFTVGGTNIPDGNYYWTVTNSGDFGTTSGVFPMGGNTGTFTVTPASDATTEGSETFTVSIRSASITGTVLATSELITINDTSLTPKLQLTSGQALGFNGTDNRRVVIADNQSDWDLGDNWTIEWWQKVAGGAEGFLSILSLDSNVDPYAGIDIFINNGSIQMANGNLNFSEAAATREEWNHIAIQKNGTTLAAYINGVSQTVNGSFNGTIISSSPLNLVIGSRTSDGGTNFYDQYFNGVLSNIRISNIARYSATFTPPTTLTVDANTKLSLDGSGGGMLIDETERHTITNVGATIVTII